MEANSVEEDMDSVMHGGMNYQEEMNLNKNVLNLEMKCHAESEDLYAFRARLIEGSLQSFSSFRKGYEEKKGDIDIDGVVGIPDFWLTVLKTNRKTHNMIYNGDLEALKKLEDIKLVYPDTESYRIEFHFATNKFFKNTVLTKTYYWSPKVIPNQEKKRNGCTIYKSLGCDIDWLIDLTHAGKTGNKITLSFFSYFLEKSKVGFGYVYVHPFIRRNDFELGEFFRLHLIPMAIFYYTGEIKDETYETTESFEFDSNCDDES